jgi:hypothetical protein
MIQNEPAKPDMKVTGPGIPAQTKPENSAMPRGDVKSSQFDGPYGGKCKQS